MSTSLIKDYKETKLSNVLDYVIIGLIALIVFKLSTCKHEPRVVSNDGIEWDAAKVGFLLSDTTKPNYTPQLKVTFSQLYLRKIDTLDMITNQYLGHSLSLDQSDQLKAIFFRITRELKTDTTHAKQ